MAKVDRNSAQAKPLWHGIVLVAGGAVGAGMFALPMVSAGAWTLWSFVGLVAVWWFTYLAASILVHTNLTVLSAPRIDSPPTSFDTLVKQVLGSRWAFANNLSLVFIMMILMYAYISAGASILSVTLEQLGLNEFKQSVGLPAEQTIGRGWLSASFAALIALLVWFGTSFVARVSSVLMIVMTISFVVVVVSLLPYINYQQLIVGRPTLIHFVWAALPVYVTAFACAGLVPSLVKHYYSEAEQETKKRVLQCLFWGTLLALLIYMLWLIVTLGTIGRVGFEPILKAGGNTADLVSALGSVSGDQSASLNVIEQRMTWFSHCAIITSFLSIGLGLFHFMQDKLGLNDSFWARSKAAIVCFLPPAIASFYYPKGFLLAISYAGLFVTFSFFVVPALMGFKNAEFGLQTKQSQSNIKRLAIYSLMFGLLIAVLKLLSITQLLPKLV